MGPVLHVDTHIFSVYDTTDSEPKTKFRKQNHACLIRFLSTMLVGSEVTSEVLFQFWVVENSLPFPVIFTITGLLSLLTWLNGANMCLAAKKPIIANYNFGNPAACTSVPHSAQLQWTRLLQVCWRPSTCHAWFSFATWFIWYDIHCPLKSFHHNN